MFITFEGPEGSGKTTQYKRIIEAMQAAGYDVVATREPGGTSIAEQIRDILLNRLDNTEMVGRAEALLFSASRAQHVDELIRPALAEGKTVLCDRFYDSTLAYQGYGHGLDVVQLKQITTFATDGLKPDLTIYLDCPPEVGLKRKVSNHVEWNRLDDMDLNFHRRVYEGFKALIEEEPERWVIIDATQEPDHVYSQIISALQLRGFKLD
ncbi:MAG: dTMP kinase [Afipia sp.]|nr:dTMP kinase [Afipia sp.]